MKYCSFNLFSYICLISLALNTHDSHAQDWEAGVFAGISNYQGDLAPYVVAKESHPAFGIFGKKNFSPFFSFALSLNYGRISGSDENFDYLKIRNLHFRSDIFEISNQIEFNFFPFTVGFDRKEFTPYVFTGISVFRFNPKAYYNGQWVDLQSIGTEGQDIIGSERFKYNTINLSIPVGGGFKFDINEKLNLLIFASYQYSFTNYLDDVGGNYYDNDIIMQHNGHLAASLADPSDQILGYKTGIHDKQRANPDIANWYIFTGIKLSYKIKNPICYRFY